MPITSGLESLQTWISGSILILICGLIGAYGGVQTATICMEDGPLMNLAVTTCRLTLVAGKILWRWILPPIGLGSILYWMAM